MSNWLKANWPAPAWLNAGTTLRTGGVSKQQYADFNLATHVDDNPQHVILNRKQLETDLKLPSEPVWLNQTHSDKVIDVGSSIVDTNADGAVTHRSGTVVAVLTADCLPLLLCDVDRRIVAAIHIGWRGFVAGIVENALRVLLNSPQSTMAWTGPCISQQVYEIDKLVYESCLDKDPSLASCFCANRPHHWLLDLKGMVMATLKHSEIDQIYDANCCSYTDSQKWYSYRRDGITGRMASLIWMEHEE